jgi:putative cardiolipin synthase
VSPNGLVRYGKAPRSPGARLARRPGRFAGTGGGIARIAVAAALLVVSACAQLEPRPDLPEQRAAPPGEATHLDALVGEAERRHPDESGFRLVSDGLEAFAIRSRSALLAGRSLDVQTYIWHADDTGLFLLHRIVEAADRGVRVRLLVDDVDARAKSAGFTGLATHPQIEVRVFNPFASRDGMLSFAFEAMGRFNRINRRMHNKSWIVDNRLAVVGGRNLGDEYFGAGEEFNFTDLDFAMAGPVVRDITASFDRFWNSELAYPMEVLDPDEATPERLALLRERLAEGVAEARAGRYAGELRESDAVARLMAGDWPMEWTRAYRFVSDEPSKAAAEKADRRHSMVVRVIEPAVRTAEHGTSIISPYFVPRDRGTEILVNVAQSGREVRILTNSLAANDVAAVHGGYSRYREDLVAGGVQLWELKPEDEAAVPASLRGGTAASLHTKALEVDGRKLFVGSYNLDPRSTSLNCEQGVMVDSEVLAGQFRAMFDHQIASHRAWSVSLDDGRLRWSDGDEVHTRDPLASGGRRFQAWLAKVLRLDPQL